MNNRVHLRPKDFDSDGDIIPMAFKEEKGDLISRNDLEKFKILPFDKASYDDTEINAAYQNGWNDAIDRIIDNAPAVDISGNEYFPYRSAHFNGVTDGRATAIPQGEWIEGENGNIKCNQCGCEIRYSYLIGGNPDFPRFCPNCGVKMKGGAE